MVSEDYDPATLEEALSAVPSDLLHNGLLIGTPAQILTGYGNSLTRGCVTWCSDPSRPTYHGPTSPTPPPRYTA